MALRRVFKGKQEHWTLDEIKAGLDKYFEEHGQYPDAYEIDSYEYLSSARTVQRSHGGYKHVREILGLPIIHAGEYRSILQSKSTHRGKQIEWDVYQRLVGSFGEEFIHREGPIDALGWTRFDFIIFTKEGKVAVDVFYAAKPHIFKVTIIIKMRENKTYTSLNFPVYLVVANDVMDQAAIDRMMANKKNALPGNVHVTTLPVFLSIMDHRYHRLNVN